MIDAEGRCRHWSGPDDVLWLRLACCRPFWPCRQCHDEIADHEGVPWPAEADPIAMMCGRCGHRMAVSEYLPGDGCPACLGPFNPGCREHHHLYFEARD